MTHLRNAKFQTKAVALALAASFLLPLAVGCGSKNDQQPVSNTVIPAGPNSTVVTTTRKPGMSRGQKTVIVLAGAALLYYLYKKHQAQTQAAGAAGMNGHPQLYRSKNGGIYYRDAQHNPVWVTAPAPSQPVSAEDVQQYAPDYQQYQGRPTPPAPPGYRTQSFSQFDPAATQDSSQ